MQAKGVSQLIPAHLGMPVTIIIIDEGDRKGEYFGIFAGFSDSGKIETFHFKDAPSVSILKGTEKASYFVHE